MSDLYFAYGSNMSSARLAARLGPTRCLGRAVLDHFALAWNKPGLDGSGKANLRPREHIQNYNCKTSDAQKRLQTTCETLTWKTNPTNDGWIYDTS